MTTRRMIGTRLVQALVLVAVLPWLLALLWTAWLFNQPDAGYPRPLPTPYAWEKAPPSLVDPSNAVPRPLPTRDSSQPPAYASPPDEAANRH